MKRRLLGVLSAAAVACGGSSATAPPVANTVAAPAVTSPAEHLAAIKAISEKGCACTDRRCLAAIDRELADLVLSIEVDRGQAMQPEQVTESFSALERLSACMTDRQVASPSFGQAIVARHAEISDLHCACVDEPCRTEVLRTMPEAIVAFYFPLEDEAYSRYEDSMQHMNTCVIAAPETAQARAVRELTELRDAACACGDPDCAEKIQRDFDVFLENHKNTQGSQADSEIIGALAGEMAGCLQDAMPASN